MLTSIERRTSAAVAAAGAPLLDGDLGCDFERPSAMPSSRPVGRAGRSFAGGALGAALGCAFFAAGRCLGGACFGRATCRSEEHTSEVQSLMRISYAVFCLKKKKKI